MQNAECRMNDEAEAEAAKIRMTRADALSILARMAIRRDMTPEEVVAIQIAVRNISKRMFDRERWFKRKHGAEADSTSTISGRASSTGTVPCR